MSTTHYIELYADRGEVHPRLVCTAPPDAPCRQRPAVERETWAYSDPDLTPGHQCWADEWGALNALFGYVVALLLVLWALDTITRRWCEHDS